MAKRQVTWFCDPVTQAAAKKAAALGMTCNFQGVFQTFMEVLYGVDSNGKRPDHDPQKLFRNTGKIKSVYYDEPDRVYEGGLDSDTLAQHPIVIVFMDELSKISGIQNFGCRKVLDSWSLVLELADGKDVTGEVN